MGFGRPTKRVIDPQNECRPNELLFGQDQILCSVELNACDRVWPNLLVNHRKKNRFIECVQTQESHASSRSTKNPIWSTNNIKCTSKDYNSSSYVYFSTSYTYVFKSLGI